MGGDGPAVGEKRAEEARNLGSNGLPEAERAVIIARLRRIEGQVRGLQRMVEEGRDYQDVLDQVAAVRAAANALASVIAKAVALHCLRHPSEFVTPEDTVARAMQALTRSGR